MNEKKQPNKRKPNKQTNLIRAVHGYATIRSLDSIKCILSKMKIQFIIFFFDDVVVTTIKKSNKIAKCVCFVSNHTTILFSFFFLYFQCVVGLVWFGFRWFFFSFDFH